MAENVENLILSQLRDIRGELGDIRAGLDEIKSDVSDVNQKVDGLSVIIAMLAGHVHSVEERVERLEGADEGA